MVVVVVVVVVIVLVLVLDLVVVLVLVLLVVVCMFVVVVVCDMFLLLFLSLLLCHVELYVCEWDMWRCWDVQAQRWWWWCCGGVCGCTVAEDLSQANPFTFVPCSSVALLVEPIT